MQHPEDCYPSRGQGPAGLRRRFDPVVYAAPGAISPVDDALVQKYARDGYMFLEDVFSAAEVEIFRQEAAGLRADPSLQQREETVLEPHARAIRSIFRIHELSAVFGRLARDARLATLAGYLLGDDVYMHQSRLNYKPGFRGREFYWHSDFETWHMEDGMPRMRALSVSIALTDNFVHNGPVLTVPKSHLAYVACPGETPADHYRQSLRKQEYGIPGEDAVAELAQRGGVASIEGRAGSILLFDCNLMHGSNSNITPFPRSNIFFVYNAVSNRLQAPFCGRSPRPEFVASRRVAAIEPAIYGAQDYAS